jgi:RNA recognition motif-containing protein
MDVKLNYVVNCNMRRLNESSKKGSGFMRFATKEQAEKAAEKMNGFQIGTPLTSPPTAAERGLQP